MVRSHACCRVPTNELVSGVADVLASEAAEDALRFYGQLADGALGTFTHDPSEGREHIGTVPARTRVVVRAPADIVAEERAEGVEVSGVECSSESVGQVVSVVHLPSHAAIITSECPIPSGYLCVWDP